MIQPKKKFMGIAIKEAIKAQKSGDYTVGAVVIKNNKVISKAGNKVKIDRDPTHHAEVVAIKQASEILSTRHLKDCVLYTTHEPCPMCTSAAIWARMKGIVFGARIDDMIDYRAKNTDWPWRVIHIPASLVIEKGEPKIILIEGFMRDECKNLFHS